jgi:hypothetical protein
MSEDEAAEEEPTVELGEGAAVEGAPVARVASRLTWPHEKSRVVERDGDTVVRTPDGPRELADVLDGVETDYFDTRQSFVAAVNEAVGAAPVPTADE